MTSREIDDINERLERVEERFRELPTVKREEDAAAHAHAAVAFLRGLLLSMPAENARKICDDALFFIGENPGAIFPQYLKHSIADVVRDVAKEIGASRRR